jgi:hypothetical protein
MLQGLATTKHYIIMKKTLFLIAALFVSATLFAQHDTIKVNGLILGGSYTEAQIIDSLGVPSTIGENDPNFEGWITYRYIDSFTGLFNDFLFIYGSLQSFAIRGKDFKLNNFLEVGMDVSAVSQMGGVIYEVHPHRFFWAPSEEYKRIGYVTIFIDTATQKIKLISATTTSDFM